MNNLRSDNFDLENQVYQNAIFESMKEIVIKNVQELTKNSNNLAELCSKISIPLASISDLLANELFYLNLLEDFENFDEKYHNIKKIFERINCIQHEIEGIKTNEEFSRLCILIDNIEKELKTICSTNINSLNFINNDRNSNNNISNYTGNNNRTNNISSNNNFRNNAPKNNISNIPIRVNEYKTQKMIQEEANINQNYSGKKHYRNEENLNNKSKENSSLIIKKLKKKFPEYSDKINSKFIRELYTENIFRKKIFLSKKEMVIITGKSNYKNIKLKFKLDNNESLSNESELVQLLKKFFRKYFLCIDVDKKRIIILGKFQENLKFNCFIEEIISENLESKYGVSVLTIESYQHFHVLVSGDKYRGTNSSRIQENNIGDVLLKKYEEKSLLREKIRNYHLKHLKDYREK